MPDRWGRVTHKDWNAMTGMLNTISAMGQRTKRFNQEQKAMADQRQLLEDANYNASLYEPGAIQIDEGSPYTSEDEARDAAMRGTPAAKAQGKQIAVAGMEADQAIKGYADN